MTDADLDDIVATLAEANRSDTNHARVTRRKMADELIAEVRRLRAERDELRACLRIAMEWWRDLHEEHAGSRSPGIETGDDWQRCRRALEDSDGT